MLAALGALVAELSTGAQDNLFFWFCNFLQSQHASLNIRQHMTLLS